MKKVILLVAFAAMMVAIGCKKDNSNDNPVAPATGSHYTNNIKTNPVYLNLTTGDSVSVWDIAFVRGMNPTFKVNGGATGGKGYKVAQLASSMTAQSHDTTGWSWSSDVNDTTLAIGAKWMDPNSYNPTDHSLSGYDTVLFVLRYDAYNWVKLHVTHYGSGTAIFQYAIATGIDTAGVHWGTTVTDSIYNTVSGTPKPYRFGVGMVTDNAWQLGLVASYEAGYKFPYGRLNKTSGVQAAWLNQTFDAVTSVPAGTTFNTDSDTLVIGRIFNYNETSHLLSSWNKTLLVRHGAHTWKVSLDNYYSATTNTTGYITWRFAMLP